MKYLSSRKHSIFKQGFTVIEVLVGITVIALLAALSFNAFTRFTKRQELNAATTDIISVLEKARLLTLASKKNRAYGVHFNTEEITLFSGSLYATSSSDNVVTKFTSRVHIATTSFSGGGQDVFFDRLTGKTNNSGTIIVSFKSDAAASTTITIHTTGVVE